MKRCTKCGEEKPLDEFAKKGIRNGVQRHHAECRLCHAARQAHWGLENPDYVRRWKLGNLERVREHRAKWGAENPDKTAAHASRRRALKRGNHAEPYSRPEIFARWSGACAYCDSPAQALDHVTPISRGGADAEWNLVPVCTPCNSSKGAKSLAEWALTWMS